MEVWERWQGQEARERAAPAAPARVEDSPAWRVGIVEVEAEERWQG